MSDAIAAAIHRAYPKAGAEASQTLAAQLCGIIERAMHEGWDLTQVQLGARGGKATPLGVKLRQLRETAGLTRSQVATMMDWSVAKMMRIEIENLKVKRSDVMVLLQCYGVPRQDVPAFLAQYMP